MQTQNVSKNDLKFTRTDKLIMSSFIELLETCPMEKISVVDICDKAMIKRATFYNHFESKEHLFNSIMYQMQEELFLSILNKEKGGNIRSTINKIIEKVIDFLIENKPRISAIMKNNKNIGYDMAVIETMNRGIKDVIRQNKDKFNSSLPTEVLVKFYGGGFVSLAIWWLTSDTDYTKNQLIDMVNTLMQHFFNTIITN